MTFFRSLTVIGMPLVLEIAVEADAPRIVEIGRLAYASNALSSILFPGPFPPAAAEQRAEGMLKKLREDSSSPMGESAGYRNG